MPENKVVKVSFDGAKMIVAVDPNKDGEVAISINIDLAEFADEIASALFKKDKAGE